LSLAEVQTLIYQDLSRFIKIFPFKETEMTNAQFVTVQNCGPGCQIDYLWMAHFSRSTTTQARINEW